MASKLINHSRAYQPLGVPLRQSRVDGRETRERILTVARHIIVREGTEKLTLRNLCEQAHISRSTFFYHFKERSDLIRALAQDYAAHLERVYNDELAHAKAQDAYDPYLAAYGAWYEKFSAGSIDNGESPLLPLVMASRENARFLSPVLSWYRRHFDQLKNTPNGEEVGLLLSFAYDGLFFHHLFGIKELSPIEEEKLLTFMQKLAQQPLEFIDKE